MSKLYAKNRKGMVLILTFIIMTAVTAIAASFLYMTSIQTKGSGYDISSSNALWLAEAGLQKVIYNLKNDPNYRNNPTSINGSLGNGAYSVTVSKGGSTYTANSTGTVDVLSRKITQSVVVNEAGASYPGGLPDAFNYIGYIRLNANLSNTEHGVINGNFKVYQNVSGINEWTVNGAITQNSNLTIPTVDFAGYKGIANHVVEGNFTFQAGQTYTGIYYITGVTTIQNNVTINGGLVTEGTVNMRGAAGVNLNPAAGTPAIITSGNIDMSNSENSNVTGKGVIYAQQGLNLQQAENVVISGTLISIFRVFSPNCSNSRFRSCICSKTFDKTITLKSFVLSILNASRHSKTRECKQWLFLYTFAICEGLLSIPKT